MRAAVILVAVVGVAVAVAGAVLLTRSPVSLTSEVDPDVTIECDAGTGLSADDCLAWGDATLAAGPPSATFEMEDLARLALTRSLLGFGSDCSAVYAIERYPDQPVWTEAVACP